MCTARAVYVKSKAVYGKKPFCIISALACLRELVSASECFADARCTTLHAVCTCQIRAMLHKEGKALLHAEKAVSSSMKNHRHLIVYVLHIISFLQFKPHTYSVFKATLVKNLVSKMDVR